jgi:hypothetical protein
MAKKPNGTAPPVILLGEVMPIRCGRNVRSRARWRLTWDWWEPPKAARDLGITAVTSRRRGRWPIADRNVRRLSA